MEINWNTIRKMVQLDALKTGDTFEANECVYMVVGRLGIDTEQLCVNLGTGDTIWFHRAELVTPRKCTLTVDEKRIER